MFTDKTPKVLVVGAGPVGLLTALSLSRHGVSVRVIDRGSYTNAESFALALHPSTLAVLDELGLAGALISQGRPMDGINFMDGPRTVATVSYSVLETGFPFALVLPQSRLERALRTALEAQGVRVEWNRELDSISREDSLYAATITRLDDAAQGYATSDMRRVPAGQQTIHASAIVGADGIRSTMARLIGSRRTLTGPRRDFLVFEFESPQAFEDRQVVVHTDGLWNVLWPMPGGRGRVSFEIPVDSNELPRRDTMERLAAQRMPWLETSGLRLHWTGRVEFANGIASCFADGNVFLAGDAAHFASPLGVQSMNGGLLEGAYLASIIAEYQQRSELHLVAAQYDSSRRTYWENILRMQAGTEQVTTGNDWVRTHAAAVFGSIPASGRFLHRLFAEIKAMQEATCG